MPQQQNFKQGEEDIPEPQDLSFQVMPGGELSAPSYADHGAPAEAPVVNMDAIPAGALPVEHGTHWFNNKITYMILGALVLAALGAAGYFLLGGKKEEPKVVSQISAVWIKQYFSVDKCTDAIVCGDAADPDRDGFTNLEEFKVRKQTDPKNPDSDGDGLADGDEAHIYKTEPGAKFTACTGNTGVACQYDDGSQVSNEYDPLTPGEKMVAARIKQIADDTQKFKLHEPTPTTLRTKKTATTTTTTAPVIDKTTWKVYTNATTPKFTVMYPGTWPVDFKNNMLTIGSSTPDATDKITTCYLTVFFSASATTPPATEKHSTFPPADTQKGATCDATLSEIIKTLKQT